MATKILLRRDTSADWESNDPVLSQGEFGYETDTAKFKIGDGNTAWTSLDYIVDGHLNVSSASNNQVLSWSGTDYEWVDKNVLGENGNVFVPNLPTSDPLVAGQLWNDAGTLKVSSGS